MATTRVDLGFVNDDCDDRLLQSHYFASKVGGKPGWLSLSTLPKPDELSCSVCNNPLVFLLQIYSPRDRPEEDAFHRTLFLFVCQTPDCSVANDSRNVKVIRSQLPRMNQFFSYDPPPDDPADETGPVPSAAKYQPVCVVCGCHGPKQCGRCKLVSYCSKKCQTKHWIHGHKKVCGKKDPPDPRTDDPSKCGILFPEYELEMEEEICEADEGNKGSKQKDKDEADHPAGRGSLLGDEYSEQELEGMAAQETEDDRVFKRFKRRVAFNMDQVLRYSKGGEPLWVSSDHQAKEADIPACSCGSPRQFEFQVMPQLLNHLGIDETADKSLDWGTLCVYTCRASCAISTGYKEEFVWTQDFAASR